ncbi:LOW QUALITY PROTEIN: uncharacterized protein [Palaemon carinicauda]|uniref:LOW QUALITY PROTEIN: uncharacterized protein n=1 Tax=Palaemon carinicauda TaxID=392227 RepID=UPI0035B60788
MSTPPPRRRRISSLVTVRRAQSERRYLSPWQSTHSPCTKFWHPILYPSPSVAPLSAFPPLVNPKGWARIDHRLDHHHHAPRTALIPPVPPRSQQPHMIGRSQLVLSGDLWGSVRHRSKMPFMPAAQLPPLALGSPPPLMAVPPMVMAPVNLQEKLAQDRLTAFLSEDSSSTFKPRSILSCPESPLYESLVSTFSTMDDDVNLDHEYQQIPALVNPQGRKSSNIHDSAGKAAVTTPSSGRIQSDNAKEYQTVNDAKITTLDVRPEKSSGKEKDLEIAPGSQICSCQSNKSPDSRKAGSSPVAKKMDNSSQTVPASSEFHRSTVYLSDEKGSSSTETISSLSDSDTYQELERPPTVIFLPNAAKESSGRASSSNKNDDSSPKGSEVSQSPSSSSQDKRGVVSPRSKSNISSGSSSGNLKSSHSIRSNSHNEAIRPQRKSFSKSPETTYLPLTIELPETKANPRKPPESNIKRHQISSPGPHIITTLDPPIRNKNFMDWSIESNDIPPLVVNFDSESEDDLANEADLSSATTMDGNSTSLYMTEGDTTSLYSSIAELYSVIPGDTDSLVYVYKALPSSPCTEVFRQPSSVGYRIPYIPPNRYLELRGLLSSICKPRTTGITIVLINTLNYGDYYRPYRYLELRGLLSSICKPRTTGITIVLINTLNYGDYYRPYRYLELRGLLSSICKPRTTGITIVLINTLNYGDYYRPYRYLELRGLLSSICKPRTTGITIVLINTLNYGDYYRPYRYLELRGLLSSICKPRTTGITIVLINTLNYGDYYRPYRYLELRGLLSSICKPRTTGITIVLINTLNYGDYYRPYKYLELRGLLSSICKPRTTGDYYRPYQHLELRGLLSSL